jgi:hypothetical protein
LDYRIISSDLCKNVIKRFFILGVSYEIEKWGIVLEFKIVFLTHRMAVPNDILCGIPSPANFGVVP